MITKNSYVEQACSKCSKSMDQYRRGKVKICANCQRENRLKQQSEYRRVKGGNRAWKELGK